MKPTLSQLEKRVRALEPSPDRAAPQPVIICPVTGCQITGFVFVPAKFANEVAAEYPDES